LRINAGKKLTINTSEFVERYLELAEKLLMSKPEVLGDEFMRVLY